ncbi:MAG: hypothetical protein QME64_01320, partial [bacterium]|nr:hypothetical protein [bacterium]
MTISNTTEIYQQNFWDTKFANIPVWGWILCILTELAIGIFTGIIPSLAQPGLWAIGLLVFIVFILSLIRPLVSFGILMVSFPLINTHLNITYFGKNYFFILIQPLLAGIILLAFLFRIMAKLHKPQSHQIFLLVPIFLLICWSSLSTVWTDDAVAAWAATINLGISFIIVYVLFQLISTEKILQRILWFVVCSGLITATAIILSTILSESYLFACQLVHIPEFTMFLATRFDLMSSSQRASGFGPHTVMALLMSFHLFLAAALFLITPSRKTKIFLVLAMLYMVYAHLLTKSRGPLLGLLLGSFVTIFLLRSRINSGRYKPIFISILVII